MGNVLDDYERRYLGIPDEPTKQVVVLAPDLTEYICFLPKFRSTGRWYDDEGRMALIVDGYDKFKVMLLIPVEQDGKWYGMGQMIIPEKNWKITFLSEMTGVSNVDEAYARVKPLLDKIPKFEFSPEADTSDIVLLSF